MAACLLLVPACSGPPRSGELLNLAQFVAVNVRDVGLALGDPRLTVAGDVTNGVVIEVLARLAAVEEARKNAGVDPAAPLTSEEWRAILVPGLSPGLMLGSFIANPRGPDEDSREYLVRVLLFALQRAAGVPGADPS